MTGETDLTKILRQMKPELHQGEFIYCLFNSMDSALTNNPLCIFQENEAITAILPRHSAEAANIPYSMVFTWITLTIHSSLEAVGVTAAISRALTEANISCNVVAAYFHDHLFIPAVDAGRAMEVLLALSEANLE